MKLNITAKCNDCCYVSVNSIDINVRKMGHVPERLGIGGGDYIRLTIDTVTGKIDGWVPLTVEDLEYALK